MSLSKVATATPKEFAMSTNNTTSLYGFTSTDTGFRISFINGWSVSVQWGVIHYCSNHNNPDIIRANGLHILPMECKNAEVAVMNTQEHRIVPLHVVGNGALKEIIGGDERDDVLGWVAPFQLLQLLTAVSNLQTPEVYRYVCTYCGGSTVDADLCCFDCGYQWPSIYQNQDDRLPIVDMWQVDVKETTND